MMLCTVVDGDRVHGDRVCPGGDADQADDHLSVVCHETPTPPVCCCVGKENAVASQQLGVTTVGNPSPPCPTGSLDKQDVLQKVYCEYKSKHGLEFISLTRSKPSSSLPNLFDNGEVSVRSFSACKSLTEPTSRHFPI